MSLIELFHNIYITIFDICVLQYKLKGTAFFQFIAVQYSLISYGKYEKIQSRLFVPLYFNYRLSKMNITLTIELNQKCVYFFLT